MGSCEHTPELPTAAADGHRSELNGCGASITSAIVPFLPGPGPIFQGCGTVGFHIPASVGPVCSAGWLVQHSLV